MAFCAVCGLRRGQAVRNELTVAFHLFPTEPVQRQAWEDFCAESGGEHNGPRDGWNRSICSDHFEEECFRGGGKRVSDPGRRHSLRDGAVPTIRRGTSLEIVEQRLEEMLKSKLEIAFVPVDEATVKLETVCRICALEDTLHDLTLEENADHGRKFSSLTSIEIDATAPWLCERCLARLNDAYDFVQACVEAENRRKSLFVETVVMKREEVEARDEPAGQNDSEVDESFEPEPKPKVSQEYTCTACPATFEKRMDLFAHVKSHGKSRFPCQQCERAFKRKTELEVHMNSHQIEPSFFCPTCSAGFKCQASLRRHHKSVHLGLKRFACPECGRQFAQKTHLQQHAAVHVEEATVPCELCGKLFKTDFIRRMHVNTEHRPDQQEPKPIQCEVCSKQFPRQQSLIAHRICHRDSNLLCTVCGNKYKSNAILLAHMATHKGKTFACEQCPVAFKTRKSLRYHRLVHAGLKPYQCNLCERAFRCSTHLKTHQSVHTRAKPYQVKLRQHMEKQHGGEQTEQKVEEEPR
ncbi:zinc finger protein 16-like [Culex quinquefasciatus]|uniref:zinc finger protein 16-like n=1 Tax=Culex quinquefasciatus TaxID=7176 RepID=UPI0018E33054|nr:zinc finger protein 16-like [Culex quinquefasciatus]